ncbi:MAG TPA: flagellar biosynthetic protein FliR [Dongiaceae bacterium]|nr:flagellar biosynthetic protein FliR [Dongiaceae bacterium]
MSTLFERLTAPGAWPLLACLTARVGGLFLIAPLWSLSAMPRTVRTALVILISLALLPAAPLTGVPTDPVGMPLTFATELAIGLAIGLTAAALVQGVALAGEVISTQMGLQMAPLLAPLPEVQQSGLAQLQTLLAIAIYARLDGHLHLLRGLAASLRVLPPGVLLHPAGMVASVTGIGATLCGTAVGAAAPGMATLLLTQLALAVLSRAVPQLNAMMVSLPLAAACGLVMFGLSLPIVGGVLGRGAAALPDHLGFVLRALAPAVRGH